MEQKVSFNQKFVGQNGQVLEIKFEGISLESENVEKTLSLLTKIGQNFQYGTKLKEYVYYSRYLLRKFEERLLYFSYSDETGYFESVQYDCQKLSSYICKFRTTYSSRIWTELRFVAGIDNDLQISMSGVGKSGDNDRKYSVEACIPVVKKLYDLQNCGAFCASVQDYLIEAYSLFYQEAPDFGKEEDQIKAYTMIGMFVEFGLESRIRFSKMPSLPTRLVNGVKRHYQTLLYFSFDDQLGMPIETGTCREMQMLSPFGELEKSSSRNNFSEHHQAIIQLIGSVVREEMAKQSNPIDFLKTVSKSLYDGDYHFYKDTNKMCESELMSSLLKKIRKTLIPYFLSYIRKKLEEYDSENAWEMYFSNFVWRDIPELGENLYNNFIAPQDLNEISSDRLDPTRVAFQDVQNGCLKAKKKFLEIYNKGIF